MGDPSIEISGLCRIFGPETPRWIAPVMRDLGKEDQARGPQDIVITVVMGLAGAGKSTSIRHVDRLIDPTDILQLPPKGLRMFRHNRTAADAIMRPLGQGALRIPADPALQPAARQLLAGGPSSRAIVERDGGRLGTVTLHRVVSQMIAGSAPVPLLEAGGSA